MSDAKPARIRLGMVGGGKDAFIGAVHRIAARIDDDYELVAGALSATPEKARESGPGARPGRRTAPTTTSPRWPSARRGGRTASRRWRSSRRTTCTRPAAREFLKRGIHVICDKPLTATLAEAKKLAKAAADSDALFVLTHNYTGYPMVRQARAMIAEGLLGTIRVVQAEYAQDWLATPVEETGSKQAGWRTDPARSGAGGSTGDIGTHAFNLAELRDRAEARGARRRPAGLRAGPAARRQRPRAAALRGRGARHALVQPGRHRQRERAAPAGLWREGRARMGAGGPELPLVHAARRAQAAAHPRRRRRRAGGGAGQPHPGRPPGGLSRGLRQHLRRGGAGDPGQARGQAGAAPTSSTRRSRTAWPGSPSSRPASGRPRATAPGSRPEPGARGGRGSRGDEAQRHQCRPGVAMPLRRVGHSRDQLLGQRRPRRRRGRRRSG